mmetsp:Transcript_49000/g.80544  ORF Transcript_49000/g.80544 Transcript_49000/m.80544 type:complete len:132 (+) Transcript_49000:708-1103(+)
MSVGVMCCPLSISRSLDAIAAAANPVTATTINDSITGMGSQPVPTPTPTQHLQRGGGVLGGGFNMPYIRDGRTFFYCTPRLCAGENLSAPMQALLLHPRLLEIWLYNRKQGPNKRCNKPARVLTRLDLHGW